MLSIRRRGAVIFRICCHGRCYSYCVLNRLYPSVLSFSSCGVSVMVFRSDFCTARRILSLYFGGSRFTTILLLKGVSSTFGSFHRHICSGDLIRVSDPVLRRKEFWESGLMRISQREGQRYNYFQPFNC